MSGQALTVQTTDYHTGGEPFRIVSGGIPPIQGSTVLERRQWVAENIDHVRQLLVNEPRGHADMYGCFVVPPNDAGADLGVIFFHNEGYSTACGHGTIALATWAVEMGVVKGDGPVIDITIDAPSGRLPTQVHIGDDGLVQQVVFTNVPSFVSSHVVMEIDGLSVAVDVAFGGAFYAILPAASLDLTVSPDQLDEIISLCRSIKDALNADEEFVHPDNQELRDIYGVILVEDLPPMDVAPGQPTPLHPALRQRNVTVFADGEVDRSATGSGTSARLALLHSQGELAVGQMLHNHSIIDSVMTGAISATTQVAAYPAVVTHVAGQAFLSGHHTFVLRPNDPLGTGFLLR